MQGRPRDASTASSPSRIAISASATSSSSRARAAASRPSSCAALADKHIAKAEARALYEDRTPPPTPEEVEMRRLERLFHGDAEAGRAAGSAQPARRRQAQMDDVARIATVGCQPRRRPTAAGRDTQRNRSARGLRYTRASSHARPRRRSRCSSSSCRRPRRFSSTGCGSARSAISRSILTSLYAQVAGRRRRCSSSRLLWLAAHLRHALNAASGAPASFTTREGFTIVLPTRDQLRPLALLAAAAAARPARACSPRRSG